MTSERRRDESDVVNLTERGLEIEEVNAVNVVREIARAYGRAGRRVLRGQRRRRR